MYITRAWNKEILRKTATTSSRENEAALQIEQKLYKINK